jgi:hypothetical protein
MNLEALEQAIKGIDDAISKLDLTERRCDVCSNCGAHTGCGFPVRVHPEDFKARIELTSAREKLAKWIELFQDDLAMDPKRYGGTK